MSIKQRQILIIFLFVAIFYLLYVRLPRAIMRDLQGAQPQTTTRPVEPHKLYETLNFPEWATATSDPQPYPGSYWSYISIRLERYPELEITTTFPTEKRVKNGDRFKVQRVKKPGQVFSSASLDFLILDSKNETK
jgi:hypothetical protein